MSGTIGDSALRELRAGVGGAVLTGGDARYDEARALFNAMIDSRPAAIAVCEGVDDVRAAVEWARRTDTPTAVRSGGHSVAGASTVDGGLVIDCRGMKEIAVDPEARTVRCGSGLTWAEFDAATQEHGLAATGGRVSTTGVTGLTLGGGSGWLERKHGLSCDNLLAVELVTAEGAQVRASATEHPDLFWALHGGGGNFGVATALEFQLYPVGPIVLAGLMLWPADRGRDVVDAMRETMTSAPDELALATVFLTGPAEPFVPQHLHGQPCVAMAFMWAGDTEDGDSHAAPLRALDPEVDLVGPIPYAEFQKMIDDPPGMRNYWTADYMSELDDAAAAAFVEGSGRRPSPSPSQSILFPWGGAVARASEDDTPMAQRDALWVAHPFAVWETADDDDAFITWAREMSAGMKPFTSGGVYLNFIGDEGQDRVKDAFGPSYDRLARIKATYDPDNFWSRNQNIVPSYAGAT